MPPSLQGSTEQQPENCCCVLDGAQVQREAAPQTIWVWREWRRMPISVSARGGVQLGSRQFLTEREGEGEKDKGGRERERDITQNIQVYAMKQAGRHKARHRRGQSGVSPLLFSPSLLLLSLLSLLSPICFLLPSCSRDARRALPLPQLARQAIRASCSPSPQQQINCSHPRVPPPRARVMRCAASR